MGHRRSTRDTYSGRDSYHRDSYRDSYRDRDHRRSDRDKDRDPYGRDSRDWRDRRSPPRSSRYSPDYRRRGSYSRSPPRGSSPRKDFDGPPGNGATTSSNQAEKVVVGEGSASQGVPVVVSVIDRRKHGQEVSFVQAQVIEEVHGGHPAASLKLAMFSLLPYLEACKTWFSRSLFQTENQVQNFDYFACIRFRIFISLYYYVLHYQLSFP